jgi:hypothetical protein
LNTHITHLIVSLLLLLLLLSFLVSGVALSSEETEHFVPNKQDTTNLFPFSESKHTLFEIF